MQPVRFWYYERKVIKLNIDFIMKECPNCGYTDFISEIVVVTDGLKEQHSEDVLMLECKRCHKLLFEDDVAEEYQRIITLLTARNVKCSRLALFGDWAVNEDGDIINTNKNCSYYLISADNPVLRTRSERINHLRSKNWFDDEQERNILKALDYIRGM